MSRVPSCSIRRILHDDDLGSVLHDEKSSHHGKPRKIGAKMNWCPIDVLGDQKLCGHRSRCV